MLKVSAHRFARGFRIAPFNGRQNPLVMKLSPLGSAIDIENSAALLAQKADDRIEQRENQRIPCRFRQRQMKIEIGLHISFGISADCDP